MEKKKLGDKGIRGLYFSAKESFWYDFFSYTKLSWFSIAICLLCIFLAVFLDKDTHIKSLSILEITGVLFLISYAFSFLMNLYFMVDDDSSFRTCMLRLKAKLHRKPRYLGQFICPSCLKTINTKLLHFTCPFCDAEYTNCEKALFEGCFHDNAVIQFIECYHCHKPIDLFAPYDKHKVEMMRYE